MSANSSSNDSLLHPNSSFDSYFVHPGMVCFTSSPGSFIFITYCVTHVLLLLPLSTSILYLGLQQWQQHRSTSTAAVMSHSESITYHMVTMELFGVLGYISYCFGIYRAHLEMYMVGYIHLSFNWYGEMFFHVLTCVERYLAVVHPIIYLSLKGERGVRIRNISTGCVWLLSFEGACLVFYEEVSILNDFLSVIFSFTVTSFCSLSALRVLIRPGPGEQGGDRARVDQSKRRAFHTIVAILVVLTLRFCWSLGWVVPYITRGSNDCLTIVCGFWFNLPSSLVLPLLFLHRAGRLACCKITK